MSKIYDTICLKCGGLIAQPGKMYGWGGTFCHCPEEALSSPAQINFPPAFVYSPNSCLHCWCKHTLVEKVKHKECCNCGNKQKNI